MGASRGFGAKHHAPFSCQSVLMLHGRGMAAGGNIRGIYYVCVKSEQKCTAAPNTTGGKGYARVPDSILFDRGLSMTGRCLYGLLARYVFQGTVVKIGQRLIASRL